MTKCARDFPRSTATITARFGGPPLNGVWRSLVARRFWEPKAVGSKPTTPTFLGNNIFGVFCRVTPTCVP